MPRFITTFAAKHRDQLSRLDVEGAGLQNLPGVMAVAAQGLTPVFLGSPGFFERDDIGHDYIDYQKQAMQRASNDGAHHVVA